MKSFKRMARLSAAAALLICAAFQFTACSDDDTTPKIEITGTQVGTAQKNISE